MKMIKVSALVLSLTFLVSCGGADDSEATNTQAIEDNYTTEVYEDDASTEVETEVEAVETEEVASTDEMSKGVGPITSIELGDIDEALVEKGKEIFKANCTACHKMGKRFVGPALAGVTERRSPEWITNMILNPDGMVKEDPTAIALLEEYMSPMANQSLSEEDARAILEFFRTKN